MQREFLRLDRLCTTGFDNQLPGQLVGLLYRHHPASDVAAENVENDVEIEELPLERSFEPGDIPRPGMVGASAG